jgi:flagellar hook-associated protein 3 FlgL
MRITDNMRFDTVQRSLSTLRSRQSTLTGQISSGSKINSPSDDPVAAARLTRLAAQAARTADYRATIDTVRSDLQLSEGSLAAASDLMVRAKELALQGANGSLTAEDRRTLAHEVATLEVQFISTANARGARGFLFSGNNTDTAALSATGDYQGDSAEHEVEISPGVTAAVSVTGSEAFTAAGGVDAFATLTALRQALESGDGAAVAATLGNLESSRAQIVRVQAKTGLIMNRLDSSEEALSVTALELERRRGEIGDVDPFSALSELSQLSTTLEQAIAVARTTLNGSGNGNLF